MENQLSLQVNIIIVSFCTTAFCQLGKSSIAHVVAVRIFEWHHRPHAGYVMIRQSAHIGVQRIVQIKANKLCIDVEINIFVDLRVDFSCKVITFQVVITITQITVLVQIVS